MTAPLHGDRRPTALLIHGSGTDRMTWSIQLATLRERFAMIAYDRRAEGSVEEHAADAAAHLAGVAQPLLIGSSFGAVVALELLRSRAVRCAGAVLIEPAMGAADDAHPPVALLDEFDRRVATLGGPAAAEYFVRHVIGDELYDDIPEQFHERTNARWRAIRADCAAAIAYRPRYAELRSIDTPILLLGGERSLRFRPTLEALRAALPAARLEILARAGHLLHAEAAPQFAELVTAFAAAVAGAGARES